MEINHSDENLKNLNYDLYIFDDDRIVKTIDNLLCGNNYCYIDLLLSTKGNNYCYNDLLPCTKGNNCCYNYLLPCTRGNKYCIKDLFKMK